MRSTIITGCFVVIIGGFACKSSPVIYSQPPIISVQDSTFSVVNPFWSIDGKEFYCLRGNLQTHGDDIYQVNPESGVASLVLTDTLAKDSPALSPDGQVIAYAAAEIGRLLCCAHVWVVNIDGTNARDLTPFGGNWENIRWSPDSRYLLFEGGVRDSGIVNYQIAKADVQTGDVQLLTRGNYGSRDASFLAIGEKIVYSSSRIRTDYGGKVWLMDADGMNPVPIDTTRTASIGPRPSPTGNEIIFAWGLGLEADAGIYSVGLDSVSLPTEKSAFRYVAQGMRFPQWSPDGNKIAYLVQMSSLTNDFFIMDNDGGNVRRLTTNFDVHLFSYSWSSDSKRLVFNAEDRNDSAISTYIYDLGSLTLRKVNMSRH